MPKNVSEGLAFDLFMLYRYHKYDVIALFLHRVASLFCEGGYFGSRPFPFIGRYYEEKGLIIVGRLEFHRYIV